MAAAFIPHSPNYAHPPSQMIISFEYGRLGTRGFMDGVLAGGVIGLPPVLNFGSPELQAKVVPEVLDGKKYICLAITEAFAGSDVSGLQTTAVKDGDSWVVTGTKKWITNGVFSDYFTTACKTDVRFLTSLCEGSRSPYIFLSHRKGLLSSSFREMIMFRQEQSRLHIRQQLGRHSSRSTKSGCPLRIHLARKVTG